MNDRIAGALLLSMYGDAAGTPQEPAGLRPRPPAGRAGAPDEDEAPVIGDGQRGDHEAGVDVGHVAAVPAMVSMAILPVDRAELERAAAP